MQNLFKVHSEAVEEFDTRGGGKGRSRRVILLDASPEGKPMAQFWELNLPGDHPELGQGTTQRIEVQEIMRIFSGRPQVRGTVIAQASSQTPRSNSRA